MGKGNGLVHRETLQYSSIGDSLNGRRMLCEPPHELTGKYPQKTQCFAQSWEQFVESLRHQTKVGADTWVTLRNGKFNNEQQTHHAAIDLLDPVAVLLA